MTHPVTHPRSRLLQAGRLTHHDRHSLRWIDTWIAAPRATKALAARAKADKSEAAIGALREEILEMKKMSFIPGVAANMAENEAEPEGEV